MGRQTNWVRKEDLREPKTSIKCLSIDFLFRVLLLHHLLLASHCVYATAAEVPTFDGSNCHDIHHGFDVPSSVSAVTEGQSPAALGRRADGRDIDARLLRLEVLLLESTQSSKCIHCLYILHTNVTQWPSCAKSKDRELQRLKGGHKARLDYIIIGQAWLLEAYIEL